MQRRDVLKSVGGIGGATALGAVGFVALSDSAAAASSGLNINDASVSNDDGDLSEVVVDLTHNVSWDGFDVGVDAVTYTDEISIVDGNGTNFGQHKLLDDYLVDFSDFSAGGDWGNDDKYNFGVKDEDDTGPGPSALAGGLRANIVWTILVDPTATPSKNSVQDPAVIGTDVGDLDNDTDDSTKTYTITWDKTVKFLKEKPDGSFAKLGSDDGTVGENTATGKFKVSVGNQAAETNSNGSGSSNAS